MRTLLFADDTRGVSPVVGTVLLVGLTVLLAATISAFGLGLDFTGPACDAILGVDGDSDGGFNPADRFELVVEPVCS